MANFEQTFSSSSGPSQTTDDIYGAIVKDIDNRSVPLLRMVELLSFVVSCESGDFDDGSFVATLNELSGHKADNQNPSRFLFSLMTDDGDVLNFGAFVNYPSGPISTGLAYMKDDVPTPLITVRRNGEIRKTRNISIPTAQGTFSWSIEELANSVANQCQALEVVRRVSTFIGRDELSFSDIESCLGDISLGADVEVSMLIHQLKSAGGQLNGSVVLQAIRNIYSGIPTGSSDVYTDSIEFDDTDYTVKSFYGAVIPSILSTGAQMLVGILTLTRSVVGVIGGFALTAANWILDSVNKVKGLSTVATVDINAAHHELAAPLFQTVLHRETVCEPLVRAIEQYLIVKVPTPWFNLYIWKESFTDPASNFRAAGYINCDINLTANSPYSRSTLAYWSNVTSDIADEGSGGYVKDISIASMSDYNEVIATGFSSADDVAQNANQGLSVDYVSVESRYSPDNVIKRGIALATLYIHRVNNNRAAASTRIKVDVSTDASTAQIGSALLDAVIAEADASGLPYAMAYINKYVTSISWETLINKVLPLYQNWIDSNPDDNLRAIVGTDTFFSAYEVQGSVIPVLNFRASYQVTPPEYTPGSVLSTMALSAVAAAVVVGSISVAKSAINRAATKWMTAKYARVQDKLKTVQAAAVDDPTGDSFKTAYAEYSKEIRKYNCVARLTGRAGISRVDGWLNNAGDLTANSVLATPSSTADSFATQYLGAALGLSGTNQTDTPTLSTIDAKLSSIIKLITDNDSSAIEAKLSTIIKSITGSDNLKLD